MLDIIGDYESLTTQQLESLAIDLRVQYDQLRAKRQAVAKALHARIEHDRIMDKVKAAGLDGVVVVPDPAIISAKGN